jgi:hypothetical protein
VTSKKKEQPNSENLMAALHLHSKDNLPSGQEYGIDTNDSSFKPNIIEKLAVDSLKVINQSIRIR